jgi:hypothetical protein
VPIIQKCRTVSLWVGEKNGAIDSILHVISKSTKCNEREAAECIIRGLYKKQEEAFTSIWERLYYR